MNNGYSEYLASLDVGDRYEMPVGEIIECHKSGMGWRPISQKFGTSDKQIQKVLRENNVAPHPTGGIKTVIPDHIFTQLLADYKAGASFYAIEQKHGINAGIVSRAFVDRGIALRPPKRTVFTESLVSQLIASYKSGLTIRECALKHGCSHDKMRDAMVAAGCVMRKPGRSRPPIPIDKVVACYEAGMSLKKIVKKHGSSTNTLRRQLLAAGVTLRPSGPRRKAVVA